MMWWGGAIIFPDNHPLARAGIAEIAMEKHPVLGKVINMIDGSGEIVSQGVAKKQKSLSFLINDVKQMLEGKLKFTPTEILRK